MKNLLILILIAFCFDSMAASIRDVKADRIKSTDGNKTWDFSRNLFVDGHAEYELNGTQVSGFTLFYDGATPSTLSGANPDGSNLITFVGSSGSPLEGSMSYLFSKPAVNRQGRGFVKTISIPKSFRGAQLQFCYNYLTGGTYTSGDVGVYFYDAITPTAIQSQYGQLIPNGEGRQCTVFSTATTTTALRVAFYVTSTNAAANSVTFDNLEIIRTTSVSQANISDVTASTWATAGSFANLGTPTSIEFQDARMGEYFVLEGKFVTPASGLGAGTAQLTIPYVIGGQNTAKALYGECTQGSASAKAFVIYGTKGNNYLTFGITGDGSTNSQTDAVGTAFATSTEYKCKVRVPVNGWKSGYTTSGVTDGISQDTVVYAYGNNGEGPLAGNVNNIPFTIEGYDPYDLWDGDEFRPKEDGFYEMCGGVLFAVNPNGDIFIFENGLALKSIGVRIGQFAKFCGTYRMQKGKVYSLRHDGTTQSVSTLYQWFYHNLTITRKDRSTAIAIPSGTIDHTNLSNLNTGSYSHVTSSEATKVKREVNSNPVFNNTAEDGLATAWVGFQDTTTADRAVDGTGGSLAGLTIAASPTSPLAGSYSYLISKDAADRRGNGYSLSTITIDEKLRGVQLQMCFEYSTGGSYANNDMNVFVYDQTNGAILPIQYGEFIPLGKGSLCSVFSTQTTTTTLRIGFYISTVNASAYTLKFDDISISKTLGIFAPSISDSTAFTPTFQGFGTPSGVEFSGSKTGEYFNLSGRFITGTTTADEARIYLPYTVGGTDANKRIVGHMNKGIASAATYVLYATKGSNYLTVGFEGVGTDNPQTNVVGSGITTSGTELKIQATNIPIQGWASGNSISGVTSNSGRQVIVRAEGNNAGSVTANVTDINWTETYDNASVFNGTQFTGADVGEYVITGAVYFSSNAVRNLFLYKNGVAYRYISVDFASSSMQLFSFVLSNTNPTDVYSIRTNVTSTLSNTAGNSYINITKLNPSVIAVPEKVYAEYYRSAGDVTTTGVLVANTKIVDTHSAYNNSSGVFTAPRSGIVKIISRIAANLEGNANGYVFSNVRKNGAPIGLKGDSIRNYAAGVYVIEGNYTQFIQVNQGDTLDFYVDTINGTTKTILGTGSRYSFTISFLME